MDKKFQSYFSGKLYAYVAVTLIIGVIAVLPENAWSQKIQLTTPSTKVVKVALINHSRLRNEFKEFTAAKERLAKENKAEKKSFHEAMQLLDKQTKEQLAQDSVKGGGSHDLIMNQAASQRAEMMGNNQLKQKKRNEERITLTQEYERKINTAIDTVVAEGGFTEVKPLVKDSPDKRRSIEITDLILKKLN